MNLLDMQKALQNSFEMFRGFAEPHCNPTHSTKVRTTTDDYGPRSGSPIGRKAEGQPGQMQEMTCVGPCWALHIFCFGECSKVEMKRTKHSQSVSLEV